MVSFERYFANCFNLRAKPDFRKKAGSDTEYCEQTVPAAPLLRAYESSSGGGVESSSLVGPPSPSQGTGVLLAPEVASVLGWGGKVDQGKAWMAAQASQHVGPKMLGLQPPSSSSSSSGGEVSAVDAGAVESALLGGGGGHSEQPARSFVFGPAGSGGQLRQPSGGGGGGGEGEGFADALIHGKRRWFFMTPEAFS